jgi:hypothetical protein
MIDVPLSMQPAIYPARDVRCEKCCFNILLFVSITFCLIGILQDVNDPMLSLNVHSHYTHCAVITDLPAFRFVDSLDFISADVFCPVGRIPVTLPFSNISFYSGPRARVLFTSLPPILQFGAISHHLIPIFVGIHLTSPRVFNSSELAFLHTISPIGCADDQTQHVFRGQNVASWVSGPIVLLLRKLFPPQPDLLRNSVFLINIHHIPDFVQSYLNRYIIPKSEEYMIDSINQSLANCSDPESTLKELSRGTLVLAGDGISAIAAVGIGLPTVLVQERLDSEGQRFQKYLNRVQWDETNVVSDVAMDGDRVVNPEQGRIDGRLLERTLNAFFASNLFVKNK